MSIDAGKLDHRLTFQTNTPTANSIGEFVDTWVDTFTVWGQITPLIGNLLFQSMQANSEATGRITVRYRGDVVATMRIVCGVRIFRILSVIYPSDGREEIVIMYKESLD